MRRYAALALALFTLPLLAQEPPRFKGKPAEHYVKQLESKDAAERLRAVGALVVLSTEVPAAGAAIAKVLRDEDPRVRTAALKAAGKTGALGKEAIPALTALLDDSDPHFRQLVVEALLAAGPDRRAVPGLIEILKATDKNRSWFAATKALGKAGAEAAPALAEALKDPNPAFRQRVALALREVGPEGKVAVPALIEALRTSAAVSLPGHVPGRYIDSGPEGNFRKEATTALKLIGAAAVPEMAAGLKDPNPIVRYALVSTLRGQGPAEKVVPAYLPLLKDSDYMIRRAVIANLSELGPAARDAVPALKEAAAKDSNEGVKELAQKALRKIQADK